jgi:hypothetical protein
MGKVATMNSGGQFCPKIELIFRTQSMLLEPYLASQAILQKILRHTHALKVIKIREAIFLFSITVESSDEGFGPAADFGDDYSTRQYQ